MTLFRLLACQTLSSLLISTLACMRKKSSTLESDSSKKVGLVVNDVSILFPLAQKSEGNPSMPQAPNARWIKVGFVLFSLSACIRPGKQDVKAVESSPAAALDINDISILLPLPKTSEAIPQMLKMGFTNDAGQTPMTPALFDSIIARHDTKIEVDGKQVPLQSGAKFLGEDRLPVTLSGQAEQPKFGPFNRLDDWKVVAMRFDPCAPTPKNHGTLKEELKTYDPARCLIQLRVTSQPILKARESLNFAGKVWQAHAQDYGIHMIFTLDFAQGQAIYKDLLALKQECGDLTSSLPLMVHPCLLVEQAKVGYNGPLLQKVGSIIKRYAKNFTGLAMLATLDGDDPWLFMNGLIQNGAFVHLPIEAVKKDDPATFDKGKNGNILEPFHNGWFEQINFKVIGGIKSDKNLRVAPEPVASKVKDFILNEYNGMEGDVAKIRPKLDAIENPFENDFFSTDCASCHVAAGLYFAYEEQMTGEVMGKHISDFPNSEEVFGLSVLNKISIAAIDEEAKIYTRPVTPKTFSVSGPYIHASEPSSRTRNKILTIQRPPSVFFHFGYLEEVPSVSRRTINESILAAKTANNFFAGGKEPPAICPRQQMEQCLTDPWIWGQTRDGYQSLSYCLLLHCPKRARDLSPAFADTAVRKYRAKQTMKIRGGIYPRKESKLTLNQGEIIVGYWARYDNSESNEEDFHTIRPMKFVSPDGQTAWTNAIGEVYFFDSNKEKWQDHFELIDFDQ